MASDSLHYAMRALRKEILEFRFDYPLDVDPQAGTGDSLHYYLYSDRLKWTVMQLDAAGVPRARGRVMGEYYKPALTAWWGLVKLGHYLRHSDRPSLEAFLTQLDWLEQNAVVYQDVGTVWPNNFDCVQGATLHKAPWVSAYDQGLAISAVVRGFRLTGRTKLLELLHGAAKIFDLSPAEGGVRIPCKQGCLYAELPGGPVPGILDGFMTSLLGLHDLFTETEEPHVLQLFREGIDGLKHSLHQWDYRGKWSWYNSQAYLSPPAYHHLHRLQLQVLAELAHEPVLLRFADQWDSVHFRGSAGRRSTSASFLPRMSTDFAIVPGDRVAKVTAKEPSTPRSIRKPRRLRVETPPLTRSLGDFCWSWGLGLLCGSSQSRISRGQ